MGESGSGAEPLYHGAYIYNVDRKGRVVVPAPWRKTLGDPAILIPIMEYGEAATTWTLMLVSASEWERHLRISKDRLDWWKAYGSMATEVSPCRGTARIQLPASHRELIGLQSTDELVLRGMGHAVQILRHDDWQQEFRNLLDHESCHAEIRQLPSHLSWGQARNSNHRTIGRQVR